MIAEILLPVIRFAWPFILAGGILAVEEVRLSSAHSSLATSLKRETVLQSNLDAARQRATDLALLYAGMLPKIDEAARAQEKADHDRITTLQQRVAQLSHVPDLPFSAHAVGVWNDAAAVANGRDAGAASTGAEAVPPAAAAIYSEADVIGFVTDAADAYRDAVNLLHECRIRYNAARDSQIAVTKGPQ